MKRFILEFLRDEGGWINLAIMGASALASYLQNRKKKQDSSSTYSDTTTTNPVLDPEIRGARSTVLDKYLSRLQGGNTGFLTGYTGQGLRQINRAADLKQTALANILAARGLSSSPAAAALEAQGEDARLRSAVEFQSQIPLLGREYEDKDLSGLAALIASSPYGQTSTRSGTSTGVQTAGSNLEGIGAGINSGISAYLMSKYLNKG